MSLEAPPAKAVVLNNGYNGSGFTVINGPGTPGVATGIDTGNVFNNVVSLDGGGCTGTLINSTTVLTAAHCFFNSQTNAYSATATIGFTPANSAVATTTVPVAVTIVHPTYNGTTSSAADIALVILATPVANIPPVTLISSQPTDPNFPAKGLPIVVVGFGNNGTAASPPTSNGPNDNNRRVGQTTLGGYVPLNSVPTPNGGNQNGFAAQFRDPANPNAFNFFGFTPVQAQVTTAEVGTAPGDSGGPIFYCPLPGNTGCTPNQLIQIGDLIGGGQPSVNGGTVTFGYGDVSVWTPLNLFLSWISGNSGTQIAAVAGTGNWSSAASWTGGVAPGAANMAWLNAATTMTLDINATVSALWLSNTQASLAIGAQRTLTATTDTIINSGTVSVAGTLATPLLELTGGSLTGTGTVGAAGGMVSNYGGTVMPGTATATGTLTVLSSFQQTPSGTFSVKAGGVSADLLGVAGNAQLGGIMQVALLPQGAPIVGGTSYQVLTAAAVNGTFASTTTQPSPFIGVATQYGANAVSITLNRTATYESVALTANARQLAAAMDRGRTQGNLTADDKNILARLDSVTSAAAAEAFFTREVADGAEDEDNDVIGNQLLANLAGARMVQEALDRHLGTLRDGTNGLVQQAAGLRDFAFGYGSGTGLGLAASGSAAASEGAGAQASAPGQSAAWLRVLGGWNRIKADDNAFGLKQDVTGVIGGIDANPFAEWLPNLKSGAAFSYTRSRLGGGVETGTTDTYRFSLYATQSFGAAFVDGHLTYGRATMTSTRELDVLGLSRVANGNTHGDEWAAGLNVGVRKWVGSLLFEPTTGLSFIRVTRKGFSESGAGALDLVIDDSALQSLRWSAGLRAQAVLDVGAGLTLRPELRARFSYESADTVPTSTATMEGFPGDPFSFDGVRLGRAIGTFGGGLTLARGNALAVFGDYTVEVRQQQTMQTAWAGLRVTW